MSFNRKLTATVLAVAIGLGLSGCTKEHEITEQELAEYMFSSEPFKVDGKPFSGRIVYKENDRVQVSIELDDGYPDGVLETFHANGKRESRINQKWDKEKGKTLLDGERVAWNEEGVMVERRVAKNGVDRRHERWCDNGDRKELVEFKDGTQRKREEWHCETGNPALVHQYDADGELHGEQKTWSADGTLVAHTNYVAGTQDGLQQEWHANGQQKLKATFKGGKPTGSFEEWNESGELASSGTYTAAGEKTGLWLEGYGTPSQVHYGPDGFINPGANQTYVRALTRGDSKSVMFLLDEGQVNVNDALPATYNGDASGSSFDFPVRQWTYSVVVAAPGLLQNLVDRGADINQADSQGTTRLLRCAERFSAERNHWGDPCRPEELELIIALGGKADVADLAGRSPLDRLLDISASAERNWNRPNVPAREARVAALEKLVAAGADPNAADSEGYTPLVRALKARRTDLVRALIAAGARADTAGPNETMAVHWVFLNDVNRYDIDENFVKETLPLLVGAGADPAAQMDWDGSNVSLRDLAARHALVDLVAFLDKGARGQG